jgi:putative ubiquitin-RnfH superfamily antitoxin RatB of RatAB toxin-antitoxin module
MRADEAAAAPAAETAASFIEVQVCYAPPPPNAVSLLTVAVAPGTTVAQAIELSGVLLRHPEIDLAHNKVGVFGKLAQADSAVQAQDRIEIYRPLTADPKIARQRRVEKIRAGSSEGRKWQGREKR